MILQQFRKKLQAALLNSEWNPTDDQVREIAERITLLHRIPTRLDLSNIVAKFYRCHAPDTLTEGQDNSDLIALFWLATRTKSEND